MRLSCELNPPVRDWIGPQSICTWNPEKLLITERWFI